MKDGVRIYEGCSEMFLGMCIYFLILHFQQTQCMASHTTQIFLMVLVLFDHCVELNIKQGECLL